MNGLKWMPKEGWGKSMIELDKKTGHLPYYKQIKEIYKQEIIDGKLPLGSRVDSEYEIVEKYDVSRITARQALFELEREGLVQRGRGKGTFVIYRPKIKEELAHIRSFTDEMIELGRIPGICDLTITKEIPNQQMRDLFGLDEEEMYCVKRVRTADGVRVVYFVSYFPLTLNLPMDPESYHQSVYEVLEETPSRIDEEFSAILPTEEIINALHISKNQPILARKRVSYDLNEKKMEYTMCYYHGGLFSYTISTSDKL